MATVVQSKTRVDISNLGHATQDMEESCAASWGAFRPLPEKYGPLIAEIKTFGRNMPVSYQKGFVKPLLATLEAIRQFNEPPSSLHKKLIDAVNVVLLHGAEKPLFPDETQAAQELVSGIFTEVLNCEKKNGVCPANQQLLPSVIVWEQNCGSPYTWTVSKPTGLQAPIVSLPQGLQAGGVLAWTALGHEISGHDFIATIPGLLDEVSEIVRKAFADDEVFAAYFTEDIKGKGSRMDETLSDILGILNLGPTAAIGLIAVLRFFEGGKLSTVTTSDDVHPMGLLRGLLVESVVKRLAIKTRDAWVEAIHSEVRKDAPIDPKNARHYSVIEMGNQEVIPYRTAQKAMDHLVKNLLEAKLLSLGGRRMQEVRSWNEKDEQHVRALGIFFSGEDEEITSPNFKAMHVLAAATQASLKEGADLAGIFESMVILLQIMHEYNPIWSR